MLTLGPYPGSMTQNKLPLANPRSESSYTRRGFVVSAILGGFAVLTGQGRATAATKKKTAPTTVKKATGGAAIAATSELLISYTYTADGGGRIHNPYVSVWIEDSTGKSVRTILLEFQQGRKGKKWLNDLKRWFRADEARVAQGGAAIVDTKSSATRLPGTYSVMWDGKTDAGASVPAGQYHVCIESARERGPYELARESITLGAATLTKKFADSGSLSGITVELRTKA
jgi:hypothetical protein